MKIYDSIIELRKKQNSIIEQIKMKVNEEDSFRKILLIYNVDISNFDYSVVLINSLLFYCKNEAIYFGVECEELFGHARKCNKESFTFAYNDETRVKIIELIAKHQPICSFDIEEKLNIKHSIIYHHLNILSGEGIILAKRKNDRRFYYRINVGYFERINQVFHDSLQEYQKSSLKLENEKETDSTKNEIWG